MAETTVIGIHPSGTTIRRAELRRHGSRIEVARLKEVNVASGADAQTFSTPATDADRNEIQYIASLPGSDVMTRHWVLPESNQAETFEHMVMHRLEADLPIPIEQMTWRYRRLPLPRAEKEGQAVMVQAVKTQRLTDLLDQLTAAHIPVNVVTSEWEAIRAFCRYGLRNLTDHGTDVFILASAEQWLVAVIVDADVTSLRRVNAGSDSIEATARRCRHAIELDVPVHDVQHLWWCSPASCEISTQAVADAIGLQITPAEMSDRLITPSGQTMTVDQAAAFAPAIGLALAAMFEQDKMIRFIHRRPTTEAEHLTVAARLLARSGQWAALAATTVILATVIHLAAIASENRKMQRLLDNVDAAQLTAARLAPKVQTIDRLKEYRIDVERIVADLCRTMPPSVIISSLQLSRDQKLIIKGTTNNPKAVFELAGALRKSKRFGAVSPERTEPAKGGNFTISADLVRVKPLSPLPGRGRIWK